MKQIGSLSLAVLLSISLAGCGSGRSDLEMALIDDCQQLVNQKVSGEYIEDRDRLIAEASELFGNTNQPSKDAATYQNIKFQDPKFETGYISGTYTAAASSGVSIKDQVGTYSCFVDGSTVTIDAFDFPN